MSPDKNRDLSLLYLFRRVTSWAGQAVRNLYTAFVPLLLTVVLAGCGPATQSPSSAPAIANPDAEPPPAGSDAGRAVTPRENPGNTWVTSDDGKVALRLSVMAQRVTANESIHVAAEIRNESEQKITVLRPFGDYYDAVARGMKIWDEERQIRYTGPMASYVIGALAFAVIGPGEVVQGKLELTANFAGIERPGRYTLRYDYSYDGYWDTTAAAGNSGISNAWRGRISSRELQVSRK